MAQTTSVAIATVCSNEIAIENTAVTVVAQADGDTELIDSGVDLSDRLGDLTALIRKVASGLVHSIESLPPEAKPKKVEAEFSISFSAEAGFWFIAKGSAGGGIKVTLEWQV